MTDCMHLEGQAAWFAIQVRPRHEKSVSGVLRAKGFTEFLPTYNVRNRWADRYKEVELPLFPRYTFCHFRPNLRARILETQGVSGVVGFGNVPAVIEDDEIQAIQAIVSSGLPAEPHSPLKIGREVRVCAGPLAGLTGTLTKFRSSERLVVTVTLLQRAVAVEVDRDWVIQV